jgi:hypothetical protein
MACSLRRRLLGTKEARENHRGFGHEQTIATAARWYRIATCAMITMRRSVSDWDEQAKVFYLQTLDPRRAKRSTGGRVFGNLVLAFLKWSGALLFGIGFAWARSHPRGGARPRDSIRVGTLVPAPAPSMPLAKPNAPLQLTGASAFGDRAVDARRPAGARGVDPTTLPIEREVQTPRIHSALVGSGVAPTIKRAPSASVPVSRGTVTGESLVHPLVSR